MTVDYVKEYGTVNLSWTVEPESDLPTDGTAAGFLEGDGEYIVGSQTTISAEGGDGYIFKSWLDGSTDNPRTITVQAGDNNHVAVFQRV